MHDSVTLLLAAKAHLATGTDDDAVVTDLCKKFGIEPDDALAAVVAAELLANQPERGDPVSPAEKLPHHRRFDVTERTPCIETPHP
jgi:hypothetical protein